MVSWGTLARSPADLFLSWQQFLEMSSLWLGTCYVWTYFTLLSGLACGEGAAWPALGLEDTPSISSEYILILLSH